MLGEFCSQSACPLSAKVIGKLPPWHFLALHKSRVRLAIAEKLMYWIFKLRNRLEVRDAHHVHALKSKRKPFLVVVNHSGNLDVVMQQSILARHGVLAFTFINSDGFTQPYSSVLATLLYYSEQIPRYGTGKQSVNRMVGRLLRGDNVMLFPEGTYDFGLVMEGFTGVARVAQDYKARTGRDLPILPVCTIGMHEAYNPHVHWWRRMVHKRRFKRHHHNRKRAFQLPSYANVDRPRQKVIVRYGAPFSIHVPEPPTKADLERATGDVMHAIAGIWGQKKLRPNHSKAYIGKNNPAVGNSRTYTN